MAITPETLFRNPHWIVSDKIFFDDGHKIDFLGPWNEVIP
jgi:hypothetical protein